MKKFYETAKRIGKRALVGALIAGSLVVSSPKPAKGQTYCSRSVGNAELIDHSSKESGLTETIYEAPVHYRYYDQDFLGFYHTDRPDRERMVLDTIGMASANIYADSTLINKYMKNGKLYLRKKINGINVLNESEEEAGLINGNLERIATVSLGNVGNLYLEPQIPFEVKKELVEKWAQLATIAAYEKTTIAAKENGIKYAKIDLEGTVPAQFQIDVFVSLLSTRVKITSQDKWDLGATATLYRSVPKEEKQNE